MAKKTKRAFDRASKERRCKSSKLPIRLSMWDFGHCDPKRCSGKKLERQGYLSQLRIGDRFRGLVVTPKGHKLVSPEDAEIIQKSGIAVVECSWAKLDAVPFNQIQSRHERLLAANPVNYGRPWKLNCAEAIASTLAIAGLREHAEAILSEFTWGDSFWKVNEELLSNYSACNDSESVQIAEKKYLEMIEREYNEVRKQQANEDLLQPNANHFNDRDISSEDNSDNERISKVGDLSNEEAEGTSDDEDEDWRAVISNAMYESKLVEADGS